MPGGNKRSYKDKIFCKILKARLSKYYRSVKLTINLLVIPDLVHSDLKKIQSINLKVFLELNIFALLLKP